MAQLEGDDRELTLDEKLNTILNLSLENQASIRELQVQQSQAAGSAAAASGVEHPPPSNILRNNIGSSSGGANPGPPNNLEAARDIQVEFEAITQTVQNIQLPPEFIVRTQATGIQKEQQPALNVIKKTAKYTETSLKILQQLNPETITEEDIEKLVQIQFAQVKYLQEEVGHVVVSSNFDAGTARLYRALRRNTSILNDEAIATLERAVTVSGAMSRGSQHHTTGRGRGYNNRGDRGGRGNFNYNNNRRHGDFYENIRGRRHFNNFQHQPHQHQNEQQD